jgi:hypothetical protein
MDGLDSISVSGEQNRFICNDKFKLSLTSVPTVHFREVAYKTRDSLTANFMPEKFVAIFQYCKFELQYHSFATNG